MLDKVDPALLPPDEDRAPEPRADGLRAPETRADGPQGRAAPATDPDLPTPVGRAEPRVRRLEEARRRRRSVLGRTAKVVVQVVLMVGVLAGGGWLTQRIIADRPERPSRPPFVQEYTVRTVPARRTDYRPVFTAYGQTVAGREVELRSLVAGEIVEVSPNLAAGAFVAEGDPLVTIDRFQYEGALAEAEAGLAEAEARIAQGEARIEAERSKRPALEEQLRLAQADVDRAQRLRQRRQGTQQQLEARQLVVSQRQQALDLVEQGIAIEEAGLLQQRAALPRLEWAVRRAERSLESTVLRAPFDAVVRQSAAEVGRLVSANDVVVTLYDREDIEVRFTLNDDRFGRLQASSEPLIGREVTVVWTVGGRAFSYPATVTRLGADITAQRGGVEVFARLTGALAETDGQTKPAIRPGAFVEVLVPDVNYENVFALPDTALFGDRVYVAVDNKLQARPVEVAAFADGQVLVRDGVEAGERVLTTRITEVSEGLNVREEGEPRPNGDDEKDDTRVDGGEGGE